MMADETVDAEDKDFFSCFFRLLWLIGDPDGGRDGNQASWRSGLRTNIVAIGKAKRVLRPPIIR
ncbi:hypothetical protein ACFS07_16470 [Undibacterium arcticum]